LSWALWLNRCAWTVSALFSLPSPQHLYAVFNVVYHPALNEKFGRNDRAGIENVQFTQVDDGVFGANDRLVADAATLPDRAALLGHAPVKRGLAALKAKFRRAARLVALVAAAGAGAVAGAGAAANDLAPVRGPLGGPKV
jgi:hypothetical protein